MTAEQDVFCEVYLDSILSGRTTLKRVSPSSLSTFSSGSIVWNERMKWEGLPPHTTLQVHIWRIRSKSDKTSFASLAASQSGGTGASLKSSVSSGVALISGAGKRKEREPVLIGTVTINLPHFRRGERVEGWWAVVPPMSPPIHGFGCCGAAELQMKVTFNE